jgi:hypothetical protein
LTFAKVKGVSCWKHLFQIEHSAGLKKDYHENAVARASSLQTGCLRYIFIIVGVACGMDIPPE